jgi:hypothetical protein
MTEVGCPPRASTPVVPPPSIYELFKEDFTHKYLRNFQKSVESLFQVPSIDGKSLNIIMYEYESQKHSYKILNISKKLSNISGAFPIHFDVFKLQRFSRPSSLPF